jgi:hypothetical protein
MSEPTNARAQHADLRAISAAAIALWVIVLAGLAYGVIQTLSKVGALFS